MQYTQVNIRDAQLLFGPAVQSGPGWLSSLIADSVLAPGRAWVCVALGLIGHSQHRGLSGFLLVCPRFVVYPQFS